EFRRVPFRSHKGSIRDLPGQNRRAKRQRRGGRRERPKRAQRAAASPDPSQGVDPRSARAEPPREAPATRRTEGAAEASAASGGQSRPFTRGRSAICPGRTAEGSASDEADGGSGQSERSERRPRSEERRVGQ